MAQNYAIESEMEIDEESENRGNGDNNITCSEGGPSLQQETRVLSEFRKRKQLCDAVILVENREFHIHRAVMSIHSPYFRSLFTSNLHPTCGRQVYIPGIPATLMAIIIEYVYTRNATITSDNVEKLLLVADQLHVYGLVKRCCDFLMSSLTPENCIGIREFGKIYFFDSVANSAHLYMMQRFSEVSDISLEYVQMSIDSVCTYLSSDHLNVKNEELVFNAILRWINFKPEERKCNIARLLKTVRLGLLTTEFFVEQVKSNPFVRDSEECRPIVEETLRFVYDLDMNENRDVVLNNPIAKPRIPHEVLFVFGGWSGGSPTNIVEAYDTRADRWIVCNTIDSGPRAYHGSATIDQMVYVIGGFDGVDHFSTVYRFNPKDRIWKEVAPMHAKRCYVSVSVLGNYIYAMGGFDGTVRQNTAERYLPESNQWSLIAPMLQQRSDASATTLNGKIYICGGFNGHECLSSAEEYDPESNQWTLLPRMRNRRSGVGVIAYSGCVYAIGGFDGESRLCTVEKYCPYSRRWQTVPEMYTSRSNFAVEVIDDMIFVIGGFNGFTTIFNVECFDGSTNECIWNINYCRGHYFRGVASENQNEIRLPDARNKGTQTPTAVPTPAPAPPTIAAAAPHHALTAAPPPTPIPVSEPLLVPVTAAPQQIPLTLCRKRPNQDLMSNTPMVTNGTGLSPQHVPNSDNDAKKVKLDQSQNSRVVHMRNVPENVSDSEIIAMGLPFGRVTNVLKCKKGQALLEFEDENQASVMINYYSPESSRCAQIKGKQIYLQHSNHKQLVVDQANNAQSASAKAAVMAAREVQSDGPTVLRVIVEKMLYPVTIDILQKIFGKYGPVEKIIIFTKNNTFQALIQFSDAVSANTAKLSLDNQHIYNGCCCLKIDFSKLPNLQVKYNNEKSMDYTKMDVYGTGDNLGQLRGMLGGTHGMMAPAFVTQGMGSAPLTAYGAAAAAATMAGGTPVYASNYGPGMTGQFQQPRGLQHSPEMLSYGPTAQMPAQFGNYGLANPALGMAMGTNGTSVLLVSNLNEQMATPDALFTLFGVYGDVHRVKILYNKKDNALIQMADPLQAQTAYTNLDKIKVWGKQIRVAFSKHNMVQMPRDGQQETGLTKDFTNSPLHRFKRPGSKNCLNIFAPSAVLHLSNIPPTVTEEEIKDKFAEVGSVVAFKFFPKDRKMALIQMATVDEAIEALINLHNCQLSEANHLRVSFSRSTI